MSGGRAAQSPAWAGADSTLSTEDIVRIRRIGELPMRAPRIVVLFVSALMTIAGSLCCARQPSKPRVDGMACVDRLVLPAYPSIASSARVDLHDLTASLQLAADGAVQTVRFEGPADRLGLIGRRLFEPSVDRLFEPPRFVPHAAVRLSPSSLTSPVRSNFVTTGAYHSSIRTVLKCWIQSRFSTPDLRLQDALTTRGCL